MGISKQAVYKMIKKLDTYYEQEEELLLMIQQIRRDHPTMGVRDLYFKIQPAIMGRDAFERFCSYNNLMVSRIRNYSRTTDSSGVKRFPNLIQKLPITKINQVWQSDITYFEVNGQFYYLTFIIDAYSRYLVGYSVSKTLTTKDTVIPALKMAIKFRKGVDLHNLIFHSDGGGQYYCKDFLKLTKHYGFQNSMCVEPWENGKAERLNGVMKNNYLTHRHVNTFEELVKGVAQVVHLYNFQKPHISLNRKTPSEFEFMLPLQTPKKSSETLNCKSENEPEHLVPAHFTQKKNSSSLPC